MAGALAGSEWQSASGYTIRVESVTEQDDAWEFLWSYRDSLNTGEVPASGGDAAITAAMDAIVPAMDDAAEFRALAGLEV